MRSASRSMRSIAAVEIVGMLPRKADRGLQARERRAQLVRNVVQQAALPVHQQLELRRGAIEIATEVRELVAPPPHAVADAHIQVAVRRRIERPPEAADGLRDVPGEQRRERQGSR